MFLTGSASLSVSLSVSLSLSLCLSHYLCLSLPCPCSTCLATGPDEWDHVSPCCPNILLHWTEGGQEDLCVVSWLAGGSGGFSEWQPSPGWGLGVPRASLVQAGPQILGRGMKSHLPWPAVSLWHPCLTLAPQVCLCPAVSPVSPKAWVAHFAFCPVRFHLPSMLSLMPHPPLPVCFPHVPSWFPEYSPGSFCDLQTPLVPS